MMIHYMENILKLKFLVEMVILDYVMNSLLIKQSAESGGLSLEDVFSTTPSQSGMLNPPNGCPVLKKTQVFCDFVKMVMALAHVPLKDLDDTLQKLRNFEFKSVWNLEGEREEKQRLLLDYGQNY